MLRRRLALPLFFLSAALLAQPCAATPGQWEYTGSLNTGRDTFTATLLLDGRVLVASGAKLAGRILIHSTELYDRVVAHWKPGGWTCQSYRDSAW